MLEWEAFDFRQFFLKCVLWLYLKNGQEFRVLLDNLFSYFLIIFHMPKLQPCVCNIKVTLMSKRGVLTLQFTYFFSFFNQTWHIY